jgi:hypothetical protein
MLHVPSYAPEVLICWKRTFQVAQLSKFKVTQLDSSETCLKRRLAVIGIFLSLYLYLSIHLQPFLGP